MRWISLPHVVLAAGLALVVASGCGDSAAETLDVSATSPDQDRPAKTGSDAVPPTVSIHPPFDHARSEPGTPPPAKGSPQWLLAELTRVRAEPAPETDAVERLNADVGRRNRRIVALAEEAIAKTHNQPGDEPVFLAAVHHLLEARVQLALQNDRESIVALYDDAAALHERDPQGQAAVLAGAKLVEFAREMARRNSDREPRWLLEFARQARLFAANHPDEKDRAAEMLDAAAWSCEAHGHVEEALGCYQLLQSDFEGTPQADQAVAIVRRLELQGRPLRLAGPTFDGGYIDLERDLHGKVALVVFWDTRTRECLDLLPLIADVHRRYESRGLAVIGISLDEDERVLEAALDAGQFPWPTVFHAHRKLRRWNNPVVKFYGVRDIPELWLVDRDGSVVSTNVEPSRLDAVLAPLFPVN
ncbi:MAG TPA: TlpA disulfide reductase family protein [Planctomycetaceae bacterium]|nr:TlpA disulfide reductase family protein [Planctomycetaceae bacterium]